MSDGARYRTIKALVLDFVHRTGGKVDYDELTAEISKFFPDSKWKRTHWAWYRHQMLHGRFKELLSEPELAALSNGGRRQPTVVVEPVPNAVPSVEPMGSARGPRARDPETKHLGDAMLNHIRLVISLAAGEDLDKKFKLNRWIFSRLLQDEIRLKRPIKQSLWADGMRACQACSQAFESLKGVELHRKDASRAYAIDNCELLCRECHQELGGANAV